MGVLSRSEIIDRLYNRNKNKRLVINPIINEETQINNGSIDIRLGTEFIISKKTKYAMINPSDDDIGLKIKEYQEKTYIRIREALILHPHQFVLGCTLEYVKFPYDLLGYVIGRSSWGRLGLIIATATMVHPLFAGVLTFELANIGDTPIKLYPGIRIGQLAIHNFPKAGKYLTEKHPPKYQCATGPEFSKIYADPDWKFVKNY